MLQLGVGLDVLRPVRGVLAGGAAQGVDLLQVDGADVVLQVGGRGGLRVGTKAGGDVILFGTLSEFQH